MKFKRIPLTRPLGIALLIVVTIIWGTTFPLVKNVGEELPAAAIVTVRFVLAALVLARWLVDADWLRVRHGVTLGLILFVSFSTQTIGLQTVSSGRGAFITALNVIFVPLALPLLGRQLQKVVLLAAALAVIGIAMLSWDDGALSFSTGDAWILVCALMYALYVLLLERYAHQHPALGLTALQVATVGVCGLIWLAVSGFGDVADSLKSASSANWVTLVYLGVVAIALATLLQTYASQIVPAVIAAVVYALEPVCGAIASWLWRGETLKPIGFLGAALILVAMVISQLGPTETATVTTSAD
jgi:drug/metabolite transporter (DMT)-like permease